MKRLIGANDGSGGGRTPRTRRRSPAAVRRLRRPAGRPSAGHGCARFGLADHAGGRAPDVGIDYAAQTPTRRATVRHPRRSAGSTPTALAYARRSDQGVRARSSVNGRYPMGRGRRPRTAPGLVDSAHSHPARTASRTSACAPVDGFTGRAAVGVAGSASPPPGARSRSTSAGSPAGSRRGAAPPGTGPERRIRALLRRQQLAALRGGEELPLRRAGALVGALRAVGGSSKSSCTRWEVTALVRMPGTQSNATLGNAA